METTLLWLWRRLAAVAPIGPLAWEPPSAVGEALKRPKKKKKKRKSETKSNSKEIRNTLPSKQERKARW